MSAVPQFPASRRLHKPDATAAREGIEERPGDVIAESLFEVELELHDAAARLGTRPDRHPEDLLGIVRRMSHLRSFVGIMRRIGDLTEEKITLPR